MFGGLIPGDSLLYYLGCKSIAIPVKQQFNEEQNNG